MRSRAYARASEAVLEQEWQREGAIEEETIATQEDAVSTDVLPTRVADFARMRSYEAANITSPAHSVEVDETEVNRG